MENCKDHIICGLCFCESNDTSKSKVWIQLKPTFYPTLLVGTIEINLISCIYLPLSASQFLDWTNIFFADNEKHGKPSYGKRRKMKKPARSSVL